MIVEDTTFLEGAEGSQVVGSKHKEVTSVDKKEYQSSKKAKGKYYRGNTVKIGSANPCERCVYTGQDCLVHHLR